jgi:biopolymer transport protein ExbD
MKLSKTDPNTDMEADMTPMIDCVFQLIMFFMLITDMTQKELEVLVLPPAHAAVEDKPDPAVIRPILNIVADGKMFVKGKLYYDPEADDAFKKLSDYLSDMARKMPMEPVDEDNPTGPKAPGNPLLIRADQATPFHYIQKVMEICGKKGIQIWKIELAATDDESAKKMKEMGG